MYTLESREIERAREQALVQRARAGDHGAFERLARERLPRIYRLLFRLLGSHEDAEDLAQECFARAWKALPEHREGGSFGAWLDRVAIHLARDQQRARGRRGPFQGQVEELPGPRRGSPLEQRELRGRLAAALTRLPERQRLAFVLRALEERDYDEVAETIGVTPATARTLVMKARRRLLRWFEPWIGGER